ncbi:hypothetical protein IEO21_08696 [Rhodonia placenta]|uniref:HNH domain-containing protein n=1 Tax=Rhodonia placenta TaxID=104341 RepID=A0A8H7NVX8_9APHY|nr:hypothetical protein IEO21_08696 [Postia placenta]
MDDPATANYTTFEACLARRILPGLLDPSPCAEPDSNPTLDDFTSYLASEIWPLLPASLRHASHQSRHALPDVDALPLVHMPLSFVDTLVACRIADDENAVEALLRRVLVDYAAEACAPPPVWSRTRAEACEICERDVPLTYHHLIPRAVHAKVRKRAWHPEVMLNSVAWLCRPCHSTVHHIASNEELARELYTIDKLLAREDVQKWRKYISKQRCGVKRG